MSFYNRLHRRSLRKSSNSARRHSAARQRLDMESLEDRRLLVADLNFIGDATIPDNYQPRNPIIEQAAELSFHGSDMVGKDGPLSPLGIDLAILFHENQQFGNQFPPSNLQLQVQNNRVAIDVTATGNVSNLVRQASSVGMTITGQTDRQITGMLPIAALDNLAALDSVSFAHAAYRPITGSGPTLSEGDQAHNSDLARAKFDVDGSGITVGVISDSFNVLADPADVVNTGAGLDYQTCNAPGSDCELTPVNVIQDTPDPINFGTDEGRAMLQIVHDVAPGAELAFATSGFSEIVAADNTRALRNAGADVIVDDITFLLSPLFQDGIWSQAVDEVADAGVTYVSNAGNFGTSGWEGDFTSSGIRSPLGGTYHDFNPSSNVDEFIEIVVAPSGGLRLVLQWDQPFGSLSSDGNSATSDVDLYLYGADRKTRVAFSADANIGRDPIESIFYTNPGTADLDADGQIDDVFYLGIAHTGGPAPDFLKFNVFEGEITEYETNSSTLVGQANAHGAIATAATSFALTPSFGVSPPILNDFSSPGGGQILFDLDGNRLTTPETRLKPEVTGVDGVTTTVPGFGDFFGTSAAAPHVGAIAALMLDNAGGADSLTPAQVKSILQASAIDITDRMDPTINPVQFSLPTETIPDGEGFDFYSGFGLVDAAVALSTTVGLETGPGSISGTIFDDANGDERQGRGEGGVSGWTVFIDIDGDNVHDIVEPSAITDASGNYTLTDLPFGDYTVKVASDDSWQMTSLSTVGQRVRIGINDHVTGIDFGFRQQFTSVVGTVFNDLDLDGVRDPGEPGIEDAIVRWDQDGDGVISLLDPAVFSNANGEYIIDGLDGGQLLVQLTPLAGWVPSGDAQTLVVSMAGDTVFDVNFGLRPNFVDPGVVDPDPNVNPPDPNTGTDTTTGFVDGFILGQQFAVNDGVVFVRGLNAGTTQDVVVISSQLSVSRGYLHAWIDFDGDGNLSDNEQVLRNHRLNDGVNLVPVEIPAGVSATDVLARFRWDFERNEQPYGPSLGGEIEDYIVSIPMDADARLVAGDDEAVVAEDSADNAIEVLTNDSVGPLGGTKSVLSVGEAQNGTVTLTEDGQILYTPDPDFHGTDEFDYVMTDGPNQDSEPNVAMAHVSITVTPVNDPPTANDDTFETISESINVTLDVLSNDSDAPDSASDFRKNLTITEYTNPSGGGQILPSPDGKVLLYTPTARFVGIETFSYTITDGDGGTSTAEVTIDVAQAPTLVQFDLQTTDANGNPVSTANVGDTFYLEVSVSDIRDTPRGVFSAYLDVFYSDSTIVNIGQVDFGPPFDSDNPATGYQSDFANDQRGTTSPGLINEAGAIGRQLTSGPITGDLFRVPFVATATGTVNFNSDPADSPITNPVTLIGESNAVPNGLILPDNASISIVGAVDDFYSINEDDQNVNLGVLDNDVGAAGATLTISETSATAQGGTIVNQSGNLLYTPPANFFGTDSFNYTTRDSSGRTASAMVTINVAPVNDDPTAVDDSFEIAPNSQNFALDVLANDFFTPDVDEIISIVSHGAPDNGGTVIISGVSSENPDLGGTGLIYSPAPGFEGTETFTYTIIDRTAGSDTSNGGMHTATVTVDVRALVGFRFETTDANGVLAPSVRVGDEFLLNVYVEDLRDDPIGVFSAYLDVLYSPNLVSANGPVSFESSIYGAAQSGDVGQPGIVDEAGAVCSDQVRCVEDDPTLGGDEFFLLSVPLIARNEGIATFTGSQAGERPLHDVLLFDVSEAIDADLIRYGSTSIDIRLEGAVSDSFAVSEDSLGNVLDVLANDVVLPSGEPLTIVSVTQGSAGGTVGITNGTTLSYTPAADFFGNESFTYTIQDSRGETTQGTVNINVLAQNDAPMVDDDAFTVLVDSSENGLDVLANDSFLPDAGETLTILDVSAPNQGGSVQITAGGGGLIYTPPAGFAGTEILTYTVTDGNGGTNEGTVTITVEPEVIDPLAAFNLVFTDESGTPIESVNVGDEFQLRIFTQDVRPENPQGVFSAYMDIVYEGSAGPMLNGPIEFNDAVYPSTQRGDTSEPGLIDELGAVDGITSLRTGDPILLATIPMTSTSGGMITATSDPAEQNPPNETTLFGLGRVVSDAEIVFGMDTLTVNGEAANAAPFMNLANPLDVNNDNTISPIDALLVINELGKELPRLAAQTGNIATDGALQVSPTAYVDVNGDNVVSPIDALMVINSIGTSVQVAAAAPLGLDAENFAPHVIDSHVIDSQVIDSQVIAPQVINASSSTSHNRATPAVSNGPVTHRIASRSNQPIALLNGPAEQTELESSLRSWHQAHREYGPDQLAVDAAMEDTEGIIEVLAEDIMQAWTK